MPPLLDPGDDHDAAIAAHLDTTTVAWLATVRPDGRPHSVPVWFAWADSDVVVFTGARSQKARNVRVNPACVVSPESADGGNEIVIVHGRAELLPPDEALAIAERTGFDRKDAPLIAAGGFAEWVKGFPQPVVVRVDHILAWSKPGGNFRFKVVP